MTSGSLVFQKTRKIKSCKMTNVQSYHSYGLIHKRQINTRDGFTKRKENCFCSRELIKSVEISLAFVFHLHCMCMYTLAQEMSAERVGVSILKILNYQWNPAPTYTVRCKNHITHSFCIYTLKRTLKYSSFQGLLNAHCFSKCTTVSDFDNVLF